jgi:hypothetical protein
MPKHFSLALKTNIWNRLKSATRTNYGTPRRSFEAYAVSRSITAIPVQLHPLLEWLTLRGDPRGNGEYLQGYISADTCAIYVSGLRSIHEDLGISTEVFDHPWVKATIQGIRATQPQIEVDRAEPITEAILQKIIDVDVNTTQLSHAAKVDELNFVASSATCFGGFMRSGEITVETKTPYNQSLLKKKGLLRSDVTFSDLDEHIIVHLKASKTDYNYKGVDIVISASDTSTCPVRALRRLFAEDPQPLNSPLFRFANRAFSHDNLVKTLRNRLDRAGIANSSTYSGHSFRRGAASQAKMNGLSDSDIQRLGRWNSECYQRYIATDKAYRYRLSRLFLTGISPQLGATRYTSETLT